MEATIHGGGGNGGGGGHNGGRLVLLAKPSSIKLLQNPLQLQKNLNAHNSHFSRPLYIGTARCHRGDSNANETFGSRRFKFKFRDKKRKFGLNDGAEKEEEKGEEGISGRNRTWWPGERLDIDDEEEEEEEEPGILEEAIDSLWILKVFKSYGWGLPFILFSWLIATGPKAFVMTLAIPLGQLALTFAFKKFWGKKRKPKPKRRAGKSRKPSARARRVSGIQDGNDDIVEEARKRESVNRKMGYQSWVDNNGGFGNKEDAPSFGGWEELDGLGSMQQQAPPGMGSRSRPRRRETINGKLSSRGRESSETPLLLRLLIAVFPFLGSWTKML